MEFYVGFVQICPYSGMSALRHMNVVLMLRCQSLAAGWQSINHVVHTVVAQSWLSHLLLYKLPTFCGVLILWVCCKWRSERSYLFVAASSSLSHGGRYQRGRPAPSITIDSDGLDSSCRQSCSTLSSSSSTPVLYTRPQEKYNVEPTRFIHHVLAQNNEYCPVGYYFHTLTYQLLMCCSDRDRHMGALENRLQIWGKQPDLYVVRLHSTICQTKFATQAGTVIYAGLSPSSQPGLNLFTPRSSQLIKSLQSSLSALSDIEPNVRTRALPLYTSFPDFALCKYILRWSAERKGLP